MMHDLGDRITFDINLCGGRPRIRGYRFRVSDVLDMLAAGGTPEEIVADYEFLEWADISACLQYASRQLDHIVLTGVGPLETA